MIKSPIDSVVLWNQKNQEVFMKWLDEVLARVETLNLGEIEEPTYELEEGDHVIGTLEDPELKKLFHLGFQTRAKVVKDFFDVLDVDLEAAFASLKNHSPGAETKVLNALKNAKDAAKNSRWPDAQGECIMNIFWICLKQSFPELREKEHIGISKGWKVLWRDEESEPQVRHAHLVAIPINCFGRSRDHDSGSIFDNLRSKFDRDD